MGQANWVGVSCSFQTYLTLKWWVVYTTTKVAILNNWITREVVNMATREQMFSTGVNSRVARNMNNMERDIMVVCIFPNHHGKSITS